MGEFTMSHNPAIIEIPLEALLAPDPELWLTLVPMTNWVDQDEDDPIGKDAGTFLAYAGSYRVYFTKRVYDGDIIEWGSEEREVRYDEVENEWYLVKEET
jgi:hypothetical protein